MGATIINLGRVKRTLEKGRVAAEPLIALRPELGPAPKQTLRWPFFWASVAHAAVVAVLTVAIQLTPPGAKNEELQPIELVLMEEEVPAQPQPAPEIPPEPKPEPKAKAPTPRPLPAPSPVQSTTEPQPPAPATNETARAEPAPAGPPPQPATRTAGEETYITQLLAWLDRHKHYPRMARVQQIQGTAVLRLSVAADGDLVGASIAHSSGEDLLDDAAVTMAYRASPLPVPPADLARKEFLIPVIFSLNRS